MASVVVVCLLLLSSLFSNSTLFSFSLIFSFGSFGSGSADDEPPAADATESADDADDTALIVWFFDCARLSFTLFELLLGRTFNLSFKDEDEDDEGSNEVEDPPPGLLSRGSTLDDFEEDGPLLDNADKE